MKPLLALSFILLSAASGHHATSCGATCGTTSSRVPVAVYPAIPDFVYSRYGPVPVKLVHPVKCPDVVNTYWGCYSSSTRIVQIDDLIDLRMQNAVLAHEKFHVAARDVGATFEDPRAEDMVAEIVARYRLGELDAGLP